MNTENPSSRRLSTAAMAALQTGNKIEAIKITRGETGLGLKESKDLVEAYVADNPALAEQLRAQSNKGALGWIIMMVLAIAAIVYFWPS